MVQATFSLKVKNLAIWELVQFCLSSKYLSIYNHLKLIQICICLIIYSVPAKNGPHLKREYLISYISQANEIK